MTLNQFQKLLNRVRPDLTIKSRGYGDIVGIFKGTQYILRLNKGELYLNSCQLGESPIKRGRRQLVEILHHYGWIKPKDKGVLLWGSR